jgi:hypothetical protein
LVEAPLTEHKVTPLDMHEEMRLRTEEREAVKRNRHLVGQQTGRGLTIALATPDGDEAINCAVRGAVDDRHATVLPKCNTQAGPRSETAGAF